MKKGCRILSLLLVFLFVLGGCGKKQETKTEPEEKVFPSYQCDFPFENLRTVVSVTRNGETVTVSNAFDNAALSLQEGLKTDQAEPMDRPEGLDEEETVLLRFDRLLPKAEEQTPEFAITKSDVLIFRKEEEEQYFGVPAGTFDGLSTGIDALFAEKNACYKEEKKEDKNTVSFLKEDGSVAKEQEFSGKVILYKKNILLLEDADGAGRYFYDRQKAAVSQKVSLLSDYCEGYVCFAEGKQIKLESVSDKNFSYSGATFEKPLPDIADPFLDLVLTDQNTGRSPITPIRTRSIRKHTISPDFIRITKQRKPSRRKRRKRKPPRLPRNRKHPIRAGNTNI